jgi:hypothetical protein
LLQKNTGTNVFQIQKADGSGTVFIADTSDTRIGIGVQPAYTLDVAGDVNISTGSFYRVNGVAICGSAATCAPSSGSTNYIQNSVAQQTSANFNIQSTATGSIVGILQGKSGQTADILDLKDGSANIVLSVGNQGQTLVKDSSAGSTTFFQIQNSSSVSLLTANTTTGQILFPNATLSSTALLIGGDANLYRSAGSTLKTDGNFITAGNQTVSGSTTLNGTVLAQNTTNSSTSFQIENSGGTSLLTADTTNLQLNTGNLNSTGTITLQNGQGASIQLRTVSASSTGLTMSFNEITDATRATNTQGDGRQPPDSSTGIWEGTTNLISNGGFETNLTLAVGNWVPANGTTTVTRSTSYAKFGTASAKVVTDGATAYTGLDGCIGGITAGNTYTVSAWVFSPTNNTSMQLQVYRKTSACGGGVVGNTNTPFTLSAGWQRITHTFTAEASTAAAEIDIVTVGTQSATTFYVDGVQMEQKAYATPYVETNGGTATRNGGRIQAPSTGMNATTGWFTARIRPSWSSSGSMPNGAPGIFEWNNNDSNRIFIYFASASNISIYRIGGGSGGAGPGVNVTYNAGDTLTITGYWTSTTLGISVNGGAFTTAGQTTIPSSPPATFDIGSLWTHNAGAGNNLDGDILWSAAGAGTLTNGDATALNAYGNSDPTLANLNSLDSADAATMAWDGESTSYTGTNSAPISQSAITIDDTTIYRNNWSSANGGLIIQGSVLPGAAPASLAAGENSQFGVSNPAGGLLAMGVDSTGTVNAATYTYLQSRNVGGAGVSYALILQPQGGNIGIGTTNPSGKLDINQGASTASFPATTDGQSNTLLNLGNVSHAGSLGAEGRLDFGVIGRIATYYQGGSYPNGFGFKLYTYNGGLNATPGITIDAANDVGINNSSPNPNYILDVAGATNISGRLQASALGSLVINHVTSSASYTDTFSIGNSVDGMAMVKMTCGGNTKDSYREYIIGTSAVTSHYTLAATTQDTASCDATITSISNNGDYSHTITVSSVQSIGGTCSTMVSWIPTD